MKYMSLDQKGSYMAEYIWIDGSNGVRSKTKVRVLCLLPPRTASMQVPAIFGAGKTTEALLSGIPVTP